MSQSAISRYRRLAAPHASSNVNHSFRSRPVALRTPSIFAITLPSRERFVEPTVHRSGSGEEDLCDQIRADTQLLGDVIRLHSHGSIDQGQVLLGLAPPWAGGAGRRAGDHKGNRTRWARPVDSRANPRCLRDPRLLLVPAALYLQLGALVEDDVLVGRLVHADRNDFHALVVSTLALGLRAVVVALGPLRVQRFTAGHTVGHVRSSSNHKGTRCRNPPGRKLKGVGSGRRL